MLQQLLINGIISASYYAIIALSFSIIYSTSRFFHFAHAIVFTFGAYFVFLFKNIIGFPLPFSILFSIIACAVLGSLIEFYIYRPLRHKNASSLILLISSLGIYTVLQNILSLIFGDDTKTIYTGPIEKGINILGALITKLQITTLFLSAILIFIVFLILQKTKFGKAIRAVSNNVILANTAGIYSGKIFIWIYFLGSALVGIAGILVSFDVGMTPTMGFNALIMGVIVMIIGGVGSIKGIVLGSLLLGIAQNLGVWKISTQWQDAIAFAIMLIFLLFRPQGFFGKPLKKAEI